MEIPDLNFQKSKSLTTKTEIQKLSSAQHSYYQTDSPVKHVRMAYDENFKIVLESTIQKKTMNTEWVSRYFCLTPTRLIYYNSKQKMQIKGCFNLASLLRYKVQVKQDQYILKLLAEVQTKVKKSVQTKQILALNFQSNILKLNVWHDQIKKILSKITFQQKLQAPLIRSESLINPQLKIQGDNYWNKITISVKQMVEYANQLDIIFFRSKKPIASIHRLFMRSRFDHVGILLKDSCNKLLILQAIESRGVWVNEWSQMAPVFREHYQQIACRKLINGQCKPDIHDLETYLNLIIGKKYQLSLSKLLISSETDTMHQNFESTLPTSSSQIEVPKHLKQKTFFCSELVADIYIKCGLIKGKKRNQFWPRDLESDDLILQKGAKLSPLMFVDF